ncbi:MAG: hypothetical protein K0R07_1075 [Sedimentibacter sp.]|jgi:hypothetical protein|nr:hypothetical protein [Sedimentibacter sp.]
MKKQSYEEIENYFINELYFSSSGHMIESGKNQIILTAPHSASQIREGSPKIGEYRTGLIVKKLKELTNSHIAYKTKNNNDDANYDKVCAFKTDVVSYAKEHNIKLVLDFHLARPEREFNIDIGTGHGANIHGRDDILRLLQQKLSISYKDVRIDDTFAGSYPYTVSSTLSRTLLIPAIQIEINWNVVSDYYKAEKLIHNFAKIIECLEAII